MTVVFHQQGPSKNYKNPQNADEIANLRYADTVTVLYDELGRLATQNSGITYYLKTSAVIRNFQGTIQLATEYLGKIRTFEFPVESITSDGAGTIHAKESAIMGRDAKGSLAREALRIIQSTRGATV